MTTKHWILLAGAAVAALIAWRLLFPADEVVLRRQVARLCELTSRVHGEQPVAAFGKAREIAGTMAPDVEASDERRSVVVKGPEDVARHVAWAREQEDAATVTAEDLVIELKEGTDATPPSARTPFTLRVADADGDPGTYDGTLVTLDWEKREGQWLVVRAHAVLPDE